MVRLQFPAAGRAGVALRDSRGRTHPLHSGFKKGLLFLAGWLWVAAPSPLPAPDIDGNLVIDCDDLMLFTGAFGSLAGDARYQLAADLNQDARVDGEDLVLLLVDFPEDLVCLKIMDPDRFVPLDGHGRPMEGMLVQADAQGMLPPLVYRPGGHNLLGFGEGLNLVLPDGGRLVETAEGLRLGVIRVHASYGAASPLQFLAPMERSGGGTVHLPLDHVDAADLLGLFNHSAEIGLPMRVFDRFTLNLHDGRLGDNGWTGSSWKPQLPNVPLPESLDGYPSFTIPTFDSAELRLPVHGTWSLPDGTGCGPEIRVAPNHPLWLALRADGHVRLDGRVDLVFPDGPSVRADLVMDDPWYHFQLVAGALQVETLSTLSDLLPTAPASCLPGGTSDAELDQATSCLLSMARAYHLFSACTAGAAPYGAGSSGSATPPEPVSLAVAVLEAWSYSALSPVSQALPLDALQGLFTQGGQAGEAAGDTESVLRFRRALLQVKQAIQDGALSGSAEAEHELDQAIATVEATAIARAEAWDALHTLAGAKEAMAQLLEAEGLRQQLGEPVNPALMEAVGRTLDRFAGTLTASLGVRAGVYDPAGNPVIADMNRFSAHQHLRDLAQVLSIAQQLGLDVALTAPVEETLAQLALRMFAWTDAAINEAEGLLNVRGFTAALLDLLDLIALEQTGLLPEVPALAGLPGVGDINGYTARLDALFQLDLAAPYGERSLHRHAQEMERLLRVLHEMPAGVSFSPGWFERAFQQMERALAGSMVTLYDEDDLANLMQLLEAGFRHHELGERFGFPRPVDWVSERLPLVVARMITVGEDAQAWSELYRVARMTLGEADRLDLVGGDPATRRQCLEQTTALLGAAYTVAVDLWSDEEARQATVDPDLLAADMLLPGTLHMDRLAGSLDYHRTSGYLKGAFRGRLRLPKWHAALTVEQASLASGGILDLVAHGSIGLPLDTPTVTFALPARRPVHIHYEPDTGLAFSGAARATFDNGVVLDSTWQFDDPLYAFGLSARGLRLELGRELILLMPEIDEGAGEVFTAAVRRDLNAYYRSLNATLETLLPLAELPVVDTTRIGEPPAYTPPVVTVEFDAVETWANAAFSNVSARVNGSYTDSLDMMRRQLNKMRVEAESAQDFIATEQEAWEYHVAFLGGLRLIRLAWEELAGAPQPSLPSTAGLGDILVAPDLPDAYVEALQANRRNMRRSMQEHPPTDFADILAKARALYELHEEILAANLGPDRLDTDGDGIVDVYDNCPGVFNPDQAGPDSDGDGILDACDNAPDTPNPDQQDRDKDGRGDVDDQEPDNPAVPVPNACDRILYTEPSELLLAAMLLNCGQQRAYEDMGLDPNTGAVENVAIFNAMTSRDLQRGRARVMMMAGDGQVMGGDPGVDVGQASESISVRIVQKLRDEIRNTPPEDDKKRFELGFRLFVEAGTLQGLGDMEDEDIASEGRDVFLPPWTRKVDNWLNGGHPQELRDWVQWMEDVKRRVNQERKEDVEAVQSERVSHEPPVSTEPVPDPPPPTEPDERGFWETLLALLKQFNLDLDIDFDLWLPTVFEFELDRIELQIAQGPGQDGLAAAYALLERLIDLTCWAEDQLPQDQALLNRLALDLENHTVQFTQVAEAQKAWWWLNRYADRLDHAMTRYGEEAVLTIREAMDQAATDSVLAGKHVAEDLAGLLEAVSWEEVVVPLPGDLKVDYVYGQLLYDRSIPYFEGTFGGRVAFPDIDAVFEISRASLATDGSFALDAFTSTPLPFDGVLLEADLHLAGDAVGLQEVSGSGLLLFDTGESFAISAGYDAPAHRLRFNTLAQDLQLRFTDDFVIFDAGFGFDVSTATPAGTLTAMGSAGVFAARPLSPTGGVSRSDFQFGVEDLEASFHYGIGSADLRLESGVIGLPEFFLPGGCEPGGVVTNGPLVQLSPATPIQVGYSSSPEEVHFAGSLAFDNFGFEIPGWTGFSVAVCSATVDFDGDSLPVLSNMMGRITLPLPTTTVQVEFAEVAWDLSGFPSGTVNLATNVQIYQQGDFTLTLLGEEDCPFVGFSVTNSPTGSPWLRIGGGFELTMPADVLTDDVGGTLSGRACGTITFRPDGPPLFELDAFSIGPMDMQLGGEGGLQITGAALTAVHPANLFNQSRETPFILQLSGGLSMPGGPSFSMTGAQFTFYDESQPPEFTLGSVTFGLGQIALAEGLQVTVSEAGLEFENPLPMPDLVAPTNVVLLLSASAMLGVEDFQITGMINDLRARIDSNGELVVSADGVGMGIGPLPIGPLFLGGTVYIAGLTPPSDWYFAGRLSGQLVGTDAKVAAILALNKDGLLGVCLDVNAGPAGIPLGQTTLLLTGVQGGLSFSGRVEDPCAFTSWISVDDEGVPVESSPAADALLLSDAAPVITWTELAAYQRNMDLQQTALDVLGQGDLEQVDVPVFVSGEEEVELLDVPILVSSEETLPWVHETTLVTTNLSMAAAEDLIGIACPSGNCPPATVGILCQPHPDTERFPDRVILKFSAIDESFLNDLLITPDLFAGVTDAGHIADEISRLVGTGIAGVIPEPDPGLLTNGFEEVYSFYTNTLHEFELGVSNLMFAAVSEALGSTTTTVYQAIVDTAYRGIPCPMITLKVQATLSQALVSTFLSMDAGVIMNQDITGHIIDSAGVVGELNLVGVPVGHAVGYVALTDASGNPNPSVCGEVDAALGPLSLGNLGFSYECPDCVTALLDEMAGMFTCAGREVTDDILDRVAPELMGLPFETLSTSMSDDEKLAFLAELFSLPEPPPDLYADLAGCVFSAVSNSWSRVQPSVSLCGSGQISLFGIPMSPELAAVEAAATKTNLNMYFSFSPSYMLYASSSMNMFPPQLAYDEASMGVGLTFPDAGEFLLGGLSGKFNSPEALGTYLEDSFAMFLEESTYTIGYTFCPFGMTVARAQARVIMPNLVDPPAFRGPAWERPEDRNLPARHDLVLSAMSEAVDVFDKPYWKGNADDLFLAFPEGSAQRGIIQSNQLSFAQDYFPHGGLVGGGRLDLPPALVDAPPDVFYRMLDGTRPALDRLGDAWDYLENYVLAFTSNVGSLVFYMPAPNPPALTDTNGVPLSPSELMASIRDFDMANIEVGDLYPEAALFFRGYLQGRLIGIPMAEAEILAYPADESRDGYFLVRGGIPAGSWLSAFIDSATLTNEIHQSPLQPIDVYFAELAQLVDDALQPGSVDDPDQVLAEVYARLADGLPKISMSMNVDNLHMPDALTNLLVSTSASVGFYGFSPRFDPDAPGEGPLANARRDGGLAFQGSFRFADLLTLDNIELAVSPRPPDLPRLSGLMAASNVVLIAGNPGWGIHDLALSFDSAPDPGQPFLRGAGAVDPLDIHFLQLQALNGGGRIDAELEVRAPGGNGPPQVALRIDPAELSSPVLGSNFYVRIHGTNSQQEAFTFSTDSDWSAAVTASGGLELKHPITGATVLAVGSSNVFSAMMGGVGLSSGMLHVQIPGGLQATAFPGTDYQQVVTLGSPGGPDTELTISSDGTFELLGGMAPLQFGVFRVSSLSGSNLVLRINNEGLTVEDGALLTIQGVADEALRLEAFTFRADGTFDISVTAGEFAVEDFFTLSSGSMQLVREVDGIVTFRMGGMDAAFMPGTDYATHRPALVDSLVVSSNGRFAYDSGAQTLGLPGTISAAGTLAFGYNPDTNQTQTSIDPDSIYFGLVDLGNQVMELLTVHNTGLRPVNVTAKSDHLELFPVSPAAMQVEPGASRSFSVGFNPVESDFYTGTLTLESSSFLGPVEVPLSGEAVARAKFWVSADRLEFPKRRVGASTAKKLKIANIGSWREQVLAITVDGPFTVTGAPATPFNLQPGEERNLGVTFSPALGMDYSGSLSFHTASEGVRVVSLIGGGSISRWHPTRDPEPGVLGSLYGMEVLSSNVVWVVGDDGLLETGNGGRGWSRRDSVDGELRCIAVEPPLPDSMLRLHFEEPQQATLFEDSSGRGHDFSQVSTAPLSGQDGIRGFGVRFDGYDDCLDGPAFDLDDSFTISLWINPVTTDNAQAFISKHNASGGNQIIMGFWYDGYHFRMHDQTFTGGTKDLYWQHLVVVAEKTGPSTTHVTFWKDGKTVGEQDFSRVLGDVGGGLGWTLGQEWDGGTRGDFYAGQMDEVTIYNRALSGQEVARLQSRPPRAAVAGRQGVLYTSGDDGRTWTYARDDRVQGALNTWNGVAFTPVHRLALAGSVFGSPTILLESGIDGVFDQVYQAGVGTLRDLVFSAHFGVAVGDNGLILRTTNGGQSWSQVSAGLPAGTHLYACDVDVFGDFVAVGSNGTAIRSNTGGTIWQPFRIFPDPDLTQDLYDVRWSGPDQAYACGLYGVVAHLDASNPPEILSGEPHLLTLGLSGSSGSEKIWTAGAHGAMSVRGQDIPAGPVLTVGEQVLDFGSVVPGGGRSVVLKVSNRGQSDLTITSFLIRGGPFETAQVSPLRVPAETSSSVRVVYRPDQESLLDRGTLTLASNDPAGPLVVHLHGSAQTHDWQAFHVANDPVEAVHFPSADVGYAITSRVIYKSVDGGVNWVGKSSPLKGGLAYNCLSFADPDRGWVAGQGILVHTANGGTSWTTQLSGFNSPVTDIHMATPLIGVAARARGTGANGDVLTTTNGGTTWVSQGAPGPDFNPTCVWPFEILFAAGHDRFISVDDGTPDWGTWLDFDVMAAVEDMCFQRYVYYPPWGGTIDITHGWAVGGDGVIQLYDSETDAWSPPHDAMAIERTSLQAVSAFGLSRAWTVGENRIYRTDNAGYRWMLEHESMATAEITSVSVVSTNEAWAGGHVNGLGTVWRRVPRPVPPGGVLVSPSARVWADVPLGASANQVVELRNEGTTTLSLHSLQLTDDAAKHFSFVDALPTQLTAGNMALVRIRYTATEPGTHQAVLHVYGDAAEPVLTTTLTAATSPVDPRLIRFDTRPTGLELIVDGATRYTTPVGFAVVEGTPAAGQWALDSFHSVEAPEHQVGLEGVEYDFYNWEPVGHRGLLVKAEPGMTRRIANYRLSKWPVPPLPAAAAMEQAPPAEPDQTRMPTGPYVQLTDASLDVPALGDFSAEGDLFVSAAGFEASLRSSGFRIPDWNSNLVEVGEGSWHLRYLRDNLFRLTGDNPAVYVLGERTLPDSALAIDLTPDGGLDAEFLTEGDLLLLPGLLEFGPCRIGISKSTFAALEISGSARILRLPVGTPDTETWAVQQELNLQVQEGPFTWVIPGLPNPLVQLDSPVTGVSFLRLSNGHMSLQRNWSGQFSLNLSGYQLDLFGQSFVSGVTGVADDTGHLILYGTASGQRIGLAPTDFDLEVDGEFYADWDVFAPSLILQTPSVILYNDSLPAWPGAGIPLASGIEFRSDGDFDTGQIALPTFDFDGISMSSGGDVADNYLRVRREDGELSVAIRDQRSFFAANMDLALDVSTSGDVSGSFAGDVTFTFHAGPLKLDDVELLSMDLAYDSASDCQFNGHGRALGFKWGVCFGSDCAAISTAVTIGICPVCHTEQIWIGNGPCP